MTVFGMTVVGDRTICMLHRAVWQVHVVMVMFVDRQCGRSTGANGDFYIGDEEFSTWQSKRSANGFPSDPTDDGRDQSDQHRGGSQRRPLGEQICQFREIPR